MRGALLALSLLAGACNQVFGITSTELVDARYFDAPIDAPFACPPPGETPQFSRNVVQAVVQAVYEFTVSPVTGRAMALGGQGIMEGPIDEPMTIAPGLEYAGCLACATVQNPRITPEGDGMYAIVRSASGAHLVLYRFDGTSWTIVTDFGVTSAQWISSVTTGPSRRIVAYDTGVLHEYDIADGGGMTELPSYTEQDLGISSMHGPMLTADGLNMTVNGAGAPSKTTVPDVMYYADRPDLTARFSIARPLVDVPAVDGGYLTENCSRIYLSGLGSVFYAPRM